MGALASQITSLTIVYLNRLFGRRLKKTSKLRVSGLCAGNSPGTGEFPAQMGSNAENGSILMTSSWVTDHRHLISLFVCLNPFVSRDATW